MHTDREFLIWIYTRLKFVHKENPNVDYMHRFRNILMKLDSKQDSGHGLISESNLIKMLDKSDWEQRELAELE